MTLTLPQSLEARPSPRDTALHLASALFVTEEATLGQAAQVGGMPQADFLRGLVTPILNFHGLRKAEPEQG